jgi:hypothetical protein
MSDEVERSSDQQDEARRREALRLNGLIAEYRSRHERLAHECDVMEAEMGDLQSDSQDGGPSVSVQLLLAERDRLRGEFDLAEMNGEAARRNIEEEQQKLLEGLESAKREIAEIAERVSA